MQVRNQYCRMLTPLCLALLLAFSARAEVKPIELYVSPEGNDTAAGTKAAPLATLERARDLVRGLKQKGELEAPVRVVLRGGTYFLKDTLVFTPEDSGTEKCPVSYAAFPGETPLLSGGEAIKGWQWGTINGRACWVTEVPGVAKGGRYFKELFIGNESRPRTRLPREGYFRFDKSNPPEEWRKPSVSYKYVKGDLKSWDNLGDIDLVELNHWVDGHNRLARVDEATHTVYFSPRSALSVTDNKKLPQRYYVENVKEALTEPGQWYLDRPTGKLYYIPRSGETPEKTVVIAPRLEVIVRLAGTAGRKVSALRFENLEFRHAETKVGDSARQAASTVPGAIALYGAAGCMFYGCTFSNIGSYAVQVSEGSSDNRFIACRMENLGAGGVRIDARTEHTTVADCTIRHAGRMWLSAVGVLVLDSPRNRVLHNEIADLYYSGVSCGWTWGYGPTHTYDNRIEYNHIHDIGHGVLDDMGGIYTLGTQAGTVLRGNVIHDVSNYSYGGWGLYTDEGSSGILLEGNLVYRTQRGGFHQHYGRDNIVRNNIFALSTEDELRRTRNERIRSFVFEKNIVYLAPKAVLLDGNWSDGNYTMRENIFWCADGSDPEFNGNSLEQWQRLGRDVKSVVADPLFRNPAKNNFTLQAQSPALKMGFKPIDPAQAGPRRLDPRKVALERWPATEGPARAIVEGRLEDLEHQDVKGKDRFTKPLTLKTGETAEVIYHLWNCGPVPAAGDVVFRVLPPEAARIKGNNASFSYKLQPGEKMITRIKLVTSPRNGPEGCRLVTIPRGEGLVPSALHFLGPKQK